MLDLSLMLKSNSSPRLPTPSSRILLCQFGPKMGAGTDSALEVGEAELFVGAVGIVVVLPPAQQEHVGVELVGEGIDDRDRAALADVHRRRAEAGFDRGGGGPNIRTFQRHH